MVSVVMTRAEYDVSTEKFYQRVGLEHTNQKLYAHSFFLLALYHVPIREK